jgi:hypothetical protein
MQIVAVLLMVSLITKNSEIHLMNTILLEPRKALNKASSSNQTKSYYWEF